MEKPETSSRPGEALSPATEVTTAVAEFVAEFKTFRDAIDDRFQQQESRLTMLDRKTHVGQRPALAVTAEQEVPHTKAFAAYLRSGDDDGLRGLDLDGKAMSTAVSADGGYLVDVQTSDAIQGVLRSAASLRKIANVVQVESGAYDALIDHTDTGAGWADETTSSSETGTPQIDRVSIPLHELNALPKISQRLLDDSAFDVENWLAERIADKFMRSESAAFVSGDGVDKPKGFITYNSAAAGSEAWGELGHVLSGADGDFDLNDPADALVDLIYSLGARYRANASFVMNSKTAGAVRKIKDAEGRYMWSDGLTAAEPSRLMGYPVLILEDMPDIATWAPAIAFGDFNAGYTVAERPDLRVLRDPFSAKPHVLFYATKRVGGDVTDFAAIKLLKFAA